MEGLRDLIKEYEHEEMEKKIYKLIPPSWHAEMRMFTEDEFSDTASRDGTLIKAADDLAAFIESYLSLENGKVTISRMPGVRYARNIGQKQYVALISAKFIKSSSALPPRLLL